MNTVLRPACLSDVGIDRDNLYYAQQSDSADENDDIALMELYDEEWRLRGYERSP